MRQRQLILASVIVLLILSGCASVDFDYPKEDSRAPAKEDTASTFAGQAVARVSAGQPEEYSGFFTMSDAIPALAARLVMAERAEVSIDAQYYLLTDDLVGAVFLESLLRAADRGVRVRLLLDDILTSGYDAGMAALDSHPYFEVRIFNPFAHRSFRAADGIVSFSRVNRRMHNKSMTVDNQITLIGGRNIANEYFGAREDSEFLDLDVLAVGPVVQDVSDMFDSYWNHRAAAPVPAFAKMPENPEDELARLRGEFAGAREAVKDSRYAAAVRRQFEEFVNSDDDGLVWAPYELAVDSPDKSDKKRAQEAASITSPLRTSIESANEEVMIISPYFVPRKAGIEWFSELERNGVDVIVITNSLAANNQKAVHGGYAPTRKPLIEAGVEIWELRADIASGSGDHVTREGARATLHTKAFIVDRHDIFIGSFNFDPRSANINTELGVIIRTPVIAGAAAQGIKNALPEHAYQVFLNEKGKLRWRGLDNGEEIILDKEPQTSGWDRFVAGFYRIMPIRSQL